MDRSRTKIKKNSDNFKVKSELSSNNFNEVEIDLNVYLNKLFQFKWLIISIVLLSIIGSYSYLTFLVSETYQSEAIIILNNDQASDKNSAASVFLATTDDMINDIYNWSVSKDYVNTELGNFEQNLSASGNNNFLTLQVLHNNPVYSADIANEWAASVRDRINGAMSVNDSEIEKLYREEVDQLQQILDQVNLKLENYAKENQIDLIDLQLKTLEAEYSIILGEKNKNDLVIIDSQRLMSELESNDDNDFLTSNQIIYLFSLGDKLITSANGVGLQIDASSIIGSEYQVSDAKQSLQSLINSLESKRGDLIVQQEKLENQILSFNIQYQNILLTRNNLNQEINIASSNYQFGNDRLRAYLSTLILAGDPAIIIQNAVTPAIPESLNRNLVIALSGLVGLAFSVFLVFFVDYWKQSQSNV